MNFKIIEDAGISRDDFAQVVGISRMALYSIIKKGNYARVAAGLDMLGHLVEIKKLPRGYAKDDKELRNALVLKLKAKLDEILAS